MTPKLISILIQNESGALSRVCGLFSARSYNIHSLCVSTTHDPSISQISLTTTAEASKIEQIIKQINKLIEVIKVTLLEESQCVQRQLSLIKILIQNEQARKILYESLPVFGANVISVKGKIYAVELVGDDDYIDGFVQTFPKNAILEVVKTGAIGLTKE